MSGKCSTPCPEGEMSGEYVRGNMPRINVRIPKMNVQFVCTVRICSFRHTVHSRLKTWFFHHSFTPQTAGTFRTDFTCYSTVSRIFMLIGLFFYGKRSVWTGNNSRIMPLNSPDGSTLQWIVGRGFMFLVPVVITRFWRHAVSVRPFVRSSVCLSVSHVGWLCQNE